MARLLTVEGTPEVLIKKMLNGEYLLKHAFEEELYPIGGRHMSYYIVEIEITKVGIERDLVL